MNLPTSPSIAPAALAGAERLSLVGPPIPPDVAPVERLRREGFAVLSPAELMQLTGCLPTELAALPPWWQNLPPDAWLRDGGHYRFRRHASLLQDEPLAWSPGQGAAPVAEGGPAATAATATAAAATTATAAPALRAVPHRAHWQPTTYNALHGGLLRWFEPIEPGLAALPAWGCLIAGLGHVFAQCRAAARWHVEAHAFRIDTAEGVGRPTPEGAHRDGVDFVAVILVQRHQVRGGETRVFEIDGVRGVRFTLQQPFSALLLDDSRVIHETTPIQPDTAPGCRDTLVLTYRAAGFLEPEGEAAALKAGR